MKKTLNTFLLLLALTLCLVSCGGAADTDTLWESAMYTEDTELGEGEKTVVVEVTVKEHSVTFTLNTDKAILGDALIEHALIDGEAGQFGLYIKKVNGITADYDADQSYWAFYQNGEYMLTGVDTTEIFGGEHYELVYTK